MILDMVSPPVVLNICPPVNTNYASTSSLMYLSPIVPILAVAVGYFFRGWEDQKKEISERIDDIVKQINSLLHVNKSYWSREKGIERKTVKDISEESEILGILHQINAMIIGLEGILSAESQTFIQSYMISLRQACTKNSQFATEGIRYSSPSSIKDAYVASASLVRHLRLEARKRKNPLSRLRC